jgi:serine/threonine protein phosphatase PrpC
MQDPHDASASASSPEDCDDSEDDSNCTALCDDDLDGAGAAADDDDAMLDSQELSPGGSGSGGANALHMTTVSDSASDSDSQSSSSSASSDCDGVLRKATDAAEGKASAAAAAAAAKQQVRRPRKCILNTAFVGDSGYLIVRRDARTQECCLLYKSTEQQHYFNAPFQLALVHGRFAHLRNTIFNDKPHDAVLDQHIVQEGDVIVTGTDGLLDNLFDFEILNIVDDMYDLHPEDIAREISRKSFERSFSGDESPFEVNARSAGQYFRGGKRDDISCVVARVAAAAAPKL